MSRPRELSTAGPVSYTWLARSRSESTSQFTASALNKPSWSRSESSSFTASALNKLSSSSSSSSSSCTRTLPTGGPGVLRACSGRAQGVLRAFGQGQRRRRTGVHRHRACREQATWTRRCHQGWPRLSAPASRPAWPLPWPPFPIQMPARESTLTHRFHNGPRDCEALAYTIAY